jgi:hypothetical protein
MFRKKAVEKIKTHFVFNNVFPKIVPFMRYVAKYCRAGQATNIHSENVIHVAFPQ